MAAARHPRKWAGATTVSAPTGVFTEPPCLRRPPPSLDPSSRDLLRLGSALSRPRQACASVLTNSTSGCVRAVCSPSTCLLGHVARPFVLTFGWFCSDRRRAQLGIFGLYCFPGILGTLVVARVRYLCDRQPTALLRVSRGALGRRHAHRGDALLLPCYDPDSASEKRSSLTGGGSSGLLFHPDTASLQCR